MDARSGDDLPRSMFEDFCDLGRSLTRGDETELGTSEELAVIARDVLTSADQDGVPGRPLLLLGQPEQALPDAPAQGVCTQDQKIYSTTRLRMSTNLPGLMTKL